MNSHLIRRSAIPAVACLIHHTFTKHTTGATTKQHSHPYESVVRCDEANDKKIQAIKEEIRASSTNSKASIPHGTELLKVKLQDQHKVRELKESKEGTEGEKKKEEESNIPPEKNVNVVENIEEGDQGPLFHDLFPLRQLWRPKVEYPLWDDDWDGRKMESTGDEEKDREMHRYVRKNGVTRHIILIRHGQYDETHKEDEKRILTPLGRKQAELTGQRLAKIIQGFDEKFGPCNVKTIRVSNMARAKETADIIAQSLPDKVIRADPDENLNEGRPCHYIPGGKASKRTVKQMDESHERIEKAYNSYIYRADPPPMKEHDTTKEKKEEISSKEVAHDASEKNTEKDLTLKPHPQHEFEIIVCHANVIRYFLCRALQIPPEAWLRLCTFNCSLTYLTVRSTGSVSCRMLGDIGHLGYEHSTFSMHHGFNW